MVGYSKELVNFIEDNRLKYNANEMAELIKKEFNKDITIKALRKYYYRHNLDYKKIYNRNYNCTIAKKIGTESNPDKNGLVRIKINEKQWQYKQRYLYEKYHNVKLDDDYYVIFADGDKTNFNKDNLIAVPRNVMKTFYAITHDDKLQNKELTKSCLIIAEIKNKISYKKETINERLYSSR